MSWGETDLGGGPGDRLLPWKRVRDMVGLSRATTWRMQQRGDFPLPVPASPGRVGWWESELDAWKASRNRGAVKPMMAPARGRGRPQLRPTATATLGPEPEANASLSPEPSPAPEPRPFSVAGSPSKPDGSPRARPATASGAAAPGRPARASKPATAQFDFGF